MTDTEKLEWACEVLNREKWDDRISWELWQTAGGEMQVGTAGHGVDLSAFAAIAIALALDEQARRKLPKSEQAEWAAAELTSRVSLCAPWRAASVQGSWFCSDKLGRVRWAKEAIAIAESLIRREMLGDTSDASPKGVTS